MAAPHVKVNRHGSISISRAALANGGWSPVPAPPPGTDFSTRRDDGQMSSAVDSLISALEGGQDDDASYEGISSLIEQMVQDDVAPGRRQQQQQFSSPARSGAGTRGGKKSSQRGPAPLVLRSGPTPYELWEGRHPVQEEKRAVVLTDAERDEVTERLGRHAANSNFLKMKAQTAAMAEELSGLTFTPSMSKKTINLTRGLEPLQTRYEVEIEHRKLRLKQQQLEVISNQLRDTTFEPDLSHTKRVNDRLLAETGQDGMTVVDRCIEYGEEAQARLRVRGEIMRRLEDRVHTFSPQITSKSREICEQTGYRSTPKSLSMPKKKTRQWTKAELRRTKREQGLDTKDNTHLVGHEDDTFRPHINNAHSHAVQRGTAPIHVRLYEQAKRQSKHRHAIANDAVKKAYRLKDFNVKRGGGGGGAKKGALINLVVWEAPEHNFIARRFGLQE